MDVVFFNDQHERFLPLTFTQPLAKLRVGILSIEEKWKHYFDTQNFEAKFSYLTEDYLSQKFSMSTGDELIFINSRYLPNQRMANFIVDNLILGEAFYDGDVLVTARCSKKQFENKSYIVKDSNESLIQLVLTTITDLFSLNGETLEADFDLITSGRDSQPLSNTNTVFGDRLFIEQGAKVEGAILNTNSGSIYIGKNAEVMEGSLVRGGFALCEGGVLKMGAKIYGPTTIGLYSKVGGEVNNCVIQDYSNKGHDGFLGNSLIGQWCNIGANTNTSNLKNNYGNVKLWDYNEKNLKDTGLQFCGLIMGDHSKCGINTMFNTGTVVGVASNVFDAGFPPKFIPSFSWGGKASMVEHQLDKMFETARRVMERRSVELTAQDKAILTSIFEHTASNRE